MILCCGKQLANHESARRTRNRRARDRLTRDGAGGRTTPVGQGPVTRPDPGQLGSGAAPAFYQAVAPDGSLPPGTMLGKYRIIRQLGQGGMGAVFEAVHTGIGKAVAIKTINPSLASDPRSEERFLREAEAASALEHPHVVGVTDFGSEGGVIYLVMELLRGEDLAALIARAPAGLDAAFTGRRHARGLRGGFRGPRDRRRSSRSQAAEHLPGSHRPRRGRAQGARFRHLEDGQSE